jgi:hypothetical protein
VGKVDGGLRALFRARVPGDWTSIESGTTSGGIPDSNFCIAGVEGWVEYKQTTGHAVTLRPDQVGWIARRCRNGGRVWIAVRQQAPAGPRRAARDALWLISGHHAVLARTGGLRGLGRTPGVYTWQGGPQRWNWAAVAATLVS